MRKSTSRLSAIITVTLSLLAITGIAHANSYNLSRTTPVTASSNFGEMNDRNNIICRAAVEGTPIEFLPSNNPTLKKVRLLGGECKGKSGWVSFESIRMLAQKNTSSNSLSRMTPIMASAHFGKKDNIVCDAAVEGTPVEFLPSDNSIFKKIKVLAGECNGKLGWVSLESIRVQ